VAIAVCALIAGCGSSSGGSTHSAVTVNPKPAQVERSLRRELGIEHLRCERAPRSSDGTEFACYFNQRGRELKLSVTESPGDHKPMVEECSGAHEAANEFVTCAVAPKGR
jgi:hypothetical protein